MSLLVAIRGWTPDAWIERLRRLAPEHVVLDAREAFDPETVTHAAVWKPEPGLLGRLPNLRAVFNLGAGVDALLADPKLPDVPIARIVDPDLTRRMTEWVTMNVLVHHRQVRRHAENQRRTVWGTLAQPAARDVTVGVMGLGVLGRDAAEVLIRLGFHVTGWSRSPRDIDGIECFAGTYGLGPFLERTDILVVLLPLTDDTRGILDRDLFARLKRDNHMGGPVLINAGRGGLQVETDILAALDEGVLAAASLDVFESEPLSPTSPLWAHPRVTITPHCAADSDAEALARVIVAAVRREEAGEGIAAETLVDRTAGY
ncbi:MAG: glyoxylate/hydroxypyruvate reductase A [Siculibacillus sp.]|nr:glyoxylate/hydroxypyruvate reductase A [Siculibacillus sp.]